MSLPAEGQTAVVADLHDLVKSGTRFGTIYADPPWAYSNQATRAATDNHYETLTVDELCDAAKFPVDALAAEDAHLHLWTTNAFLFDARLIIEAWGFTYKSCFVWVKTEMGIGNYWRVSHEFMLLGVRGSCPFLDKSLMSWAEHHRTRHSAKPHQVRRSVEKASPQPRLELFARNACDGWVVWGDEIQRDLFISSVRDST